MKHEHEERTFRDPVCGMEVSHNTASDTATHDGRNYYFCSPHCREKFEADPTAFAD